VALGGRDGREALWRPCAGEGGSLSFETIHTRNGTASRGPAPMTKTSTPAELIARSNRLGADPANTNYAGGTTSAKGTATDPVTGDDVELLWVKGSGGDLGTLTEQGLAVLRLDRMRALVDVYPG